LEDETDAPSAHGEFRIHADRFKPN
jgi:hypothetical protein